MTFDVSSSAPGKILWIGGYSVLERPNISYVTAVKAFVNARVRSAPDNEVVFDAPQLLMKARGRLREEGRLDVEVHPELKLLKTSAEIATRYAYSKGAKVEGFSVQTRNDDAFSYGITGGRVVKSGLGSSAALTVATVTGVLKAFGVKANKNQVHKLAQSAHSIATGKVGSGFDIAAATYGSILYTRYSPEILKSLPVEFSNHDLEKLIRRKWDYSVERLPMPKTFRLAFANFVGESMVTTKSIGSVSEFKKNSPERYAELVKRINGENQKAVDSLKRIASGDGESLEAFRTAFDRARELTKELGMLSNVGIEPDECTALIGESKANGAFAAKLPGAGGKDAIAALTLSQGDLARLRKFWRKKKELLLLDIRLGKKGFHYPEVG